MNRSTGEAILVIDAFPTLPVRSIRYRHRIRNYYRMGAGGAAVPVTTTWRVPTRLWKALDGLSGPTHIPAHLLNGLSKAIQESYGTLAFDNIGHGSFVFSLLADANPHQPLVIMDGVNLSQIDRDSYSDTSGSQQVHDRLLQASSRTADQIVEVMRASNVRFVNYSAGHSLPVIAAGWARDCGGDLPSDSILRQKLAAYAPLYGALFNTPGVLAIHAAVDGTTAADFPYDQRTALYPNRLRAGYFTKLDSGLDPQGRGDHSNLAGWPAASNVDLYVNTGVLPSRPFIHNNTPLLQIGEFGVNHYPITSPQTSWVAPLALARVINLRYSAFPARQMDDGLIAELFRAVTPSECAGLPESRCVYQDPLRHGDIESVRLEYRSKFYD